jgi:hypothetical protein
MSEHLSPRVNSARLPDYIGRIVRLTARVEKVRPMPCIVCTLQSESTTISYKIQQARLLLLLVTMVRSELKFME